MDDPYFQEEFQNGKFEKTEKKTAKKKVEKESTDNAAELELLLMDENDDKQHFNFSSIVKNETKKSKKGKAKDAPPADDKDFKVFFSDFSILFLRFLQNIIKHFRFEWKIPDFRLCLHRTTSIWTLQIPISRRRRPWKPFLPRNRNAGMKEPIHLQRYLLLSFISFLNYNFILVTIDFNYYLTG